MHTVSNEEAHQYYEYCKQRDVTLCQFKNKYQNNKMD